MVGVGQAGWVVATRFVKGTQVKVSELPVAEDNVEAAFHS